VSTRRYWPRQITLAGISLAPVRWREKSLEDIPISSFRKILAMDLSFSKLGTRGTSPTLYLQYFSVVVYSYDSWRVAGSQSDLLNLWEICLNAPENQQPDLSAGEK
jgi:hypothetical protein